MSATTLEEWREKHGIKSSGDTNTRTQTSSTATSLTGEESAIDAWRRKHGITGNSSRRYDFNQGVGLYNTTIDSFSKWYDESMAGLSEMGRDNINLTETNEMAGYYLRRVGALRQWANENKGLLGDNYQDIMDSLQQVTTATYWMDRGYKNQADDLLTKFETVEEYDQYMADKANRDHWTSYDIVNAYDERQKMQAPIDVLRSDYNDLYELEGAYGLLANDAVPEEERQRNQARYDEIVSRYGEGITAEDLYYQLQQLEGEYGGRIGQLDAEIAEASKYQGQSGEGGKIGSSIPWDESKPKTAADYEAELEQLNASIASMDNYIQVLNARYAELDRAIAMYSSSSDPEDISRLATAQNELNTLLTQRNNANQEYDAMMSQKWQLEHQLQYDTLGENSDYRSASVYNVGNADDQLYRYINYGKNGVNNSFLQSGEKYNEDSTFLNNNPDYIFGFMSDEQVANYNYIYATQGREAAMAYLEYLRPQMDTERTDFLVGEATELTRSGVGGAIVANALSVPLNLTSGIGYFDIAAQNMARDIRGDYAPINYNSSAMTATHLTRAIRNTTAGMITDATGTIQLDPEKNPFWAKILNGRGLADVYQLGMSAIDSKVAALTGHPAAAMALMATSAATQGILNALERGATDEQALQMGFWDGIAEAVFEYFEVENLLKGDPNWIRATMNQALTEGIGEGLTSVANNITDFLIMADKSQIMQAAAEYENQGYNRNQAVWNAIADAAIDAGWDMLGGMASGGISAAGMSTVQNVTDTWNIGRYVQENQMEDPLMELANKMAGLGDYQGKVQTYAQKATQRPSAYNVGRLYNETTRVIDQQNMDQLAQALQAQGLTQGEATKLASAIALDLNGIELTRAQERLLEKHEGNDSVAKAIFQVLGSDAYMNRANALDKLHGKTTTKAQEAPSQAKTEEKTEGAQAKVETTHAVSEDGETHLVAEPEKTVSIESVEAIEDGKMTLRLNDGRTVDSSDVSFGNDGDALIYEVLADMNVSAENANTILQQFKDAKIPAQEFALDIQDAYQYGRYNQGLKESNNSPAAQLAWNEGRMAAIAESSAQQEQVEQAYQKATEVLKQTDKKHGEYHASLEEGIEVTSLAETQKASYELADRVAQAAKTDISVYDGKTGEWGYYEPKTDTIHLNLNATNKSRKSMMAFVLGHELVHRAKAGSPKKFQAFADFLVDEYGKNGVPLDDLIEEQILAAKEHGIEMSRDEAFDEVVCDSCQRMLLDTDAGKKLAMFGAESKQNHSFLEDLKRWITEFIDKLRSLFVDVDPDSLAAQEFTKLDENVKQILADMFVDMTMEAGEHLSAIKEALGTDALIELNNSGEFTMAQNADGSEKVFNLVTWNKGGRSTLEATLLREGYTQEEVDAALTIMDAKQQLVEDIASELDDNGDLAFPEQGRINEAVLTTDIKTGHAVLTALVSNGDYPVNIDLLMVCKKRKAYQRVINRLCDTGLIKTATVDALAIAEINKILGKYGFETACLGCFVESRRLRIQEWAQTIVKEWNGQVKKRDPNAKPFGFGKGEATLTADEIMQLIGELESGGPKNDKGNLNLGQGSAVKRMGVLLDKVPSLRRTLAIEDLVTPDGLSALRQFDGNLFSMVKSRYGSNSPKFVQEFNPYNHELAMYGKVPAEYKSLREYLYAIGGARMQSFSDFIVENWFDYCQIVADLAARKLPMHTYTKEIALARLFGMTGIKVNMSLIPDIDRSLGKEYAGLTIGEDGKLQLIWADKDRHKTTGGQSYMQSINYADAIALQQDPRYSSNVGTIAIGVSDRQIRMMLADPNIRMVIPYHSSGMNPIFADMMGTSFYKDYTNFQNTTVKQMYDSKGKPVSVKLDKTQVGKLTSGFLFNETLQNLGDARAAAEAYKEWCADASLHTITIKGETYTAELTPKFDDFAKEDNYYKLLEDFNCYDCITEEAAPQRDVQQVYPENFEKILRDELKGQEGYRQKQEKNQAFDKAMAEIEGYLETHTKADTVYYAQQKGIKLSDKDKNLDAAGKEKLKQLQKDGGKFKMPVAAESSERDAAYYEWDVQAALYDSLDHPDMGYDNMIRVGALPRYISSMLGIEGDFYIYRNHAYENMVSKEQAVLEGRPITRKGENIHFHNLGVDTMTDAIMSLETPTMTIAAKTHDGNPAVIMILPVFGKNNAPLYAVLSFYSNRHINGDSSRRPHVVLTIAEREFFGNGGRAGYVDIIRDAVKDGRVIDFNKKMRDDLSVIANPAGVGNITDSSLSDNLSFFLKEIKAFKEKYHIDYKLPVGTDTSPRALLANAFESVAQTDIEKSNLEKYRSKLADLEEMEAKLSELKAQIKELSFAEGKRDKEKINKLKFEANATANRIETLDKILVRFEASEPIRKIIELEKEKVRVRTKEKVSEAAKNRRERERESMQKRDARAKLDKLVLDTVGWITAPKKGVVKCPDILKKPYMDFLNGIDTSSKTMAKGGDPTKADLRMANALGALTDTIEKITMGQDPSKESTDVFDSGYLDLPADFVKQLRDMTEKIRGMMENGGYVINSMTAQEVKDLAKHIRTLNHAIREMGTLYANKRFENAKALGKDSMHFMDALGETDGTSSVKDFVQWQNALPYYAFKRFGLGGESVFEGMMDAQDKLAFLAEQIFDFQEKTWTGDEADAWSKDVHTVELENDMTEDGKVIPRSIRLTTADAMSIYCLYQREQGRKHLFGGGVRVIGIEQKGKKAPDSITHLTENDVELIIKSLSDRQVKVATAIQRFMSDVCAEWGNEISMKRFLTREFPERNYFPIESDDVNMTKKDPSAQQSDLFRLLNISATKGIDPNANNRAIVRNIFDVFSGHAADMARLNAFALPLLDYMKWLNYREKTVTEKGHVINHGIRESMLRAYGEAAERYVTNLIKDVNGRPSDGGIPSFYSRMLKNAKTAMVGSSLRVATLQITSYPRAALVLSPKSLALGLHKLPNIKMAQKYCGIALWKSFGFYDTNISRTIEEQMKGVKDVRQKMIELSLKGAEIGDALTWGVLWNACEYEVAATNKYKTGTEEFYKAVGEKLREVVYATQVVDSILTRSETMRSKDSKMKEMSSFMSEPTLSANILMDAGFQFNMEKRRNGGGKAGAKEAWKVTGKYVGRAIAVYSIGQLAAALMEGLWDAWRDDDDEEFWKKYLKAFVENLILDLIPFNKIPILSDIAEAALSLFGLGIFSSDNLSSTALSQTVAAFKAWADVLNGKSSATVYNALYKTMRAVSSVLGVSISGVMREGVDLWNNTAGAFDNTLKIRTYESADNRSDKLFKALKNGDQKYLDKFMSSYSDEDKGQAAIRAEVKARYVAGEISESEARDYLTKYGGLDITEAYWKMKEWDFNKEDTTDDDFAKYDRFYEAVKTGANLKAVIKEYTDNGVEPETLRRQITEYFKPEYVKMSAAERAAIKGYLINAFEQCGSKRWNAEDTLWEWDFEAKHGKSYEQMVKDYKAGDMSRDALKKILLERGLTEDDANAKLAEFDISAEYGIDYSDREKAYMQGQITIDDLRDMYRDKGKTEEETELLLDAHKWLKDNHRSDLNADTVVSYIRPLDDLDYSVADTGMDIDTFLEERKYIKAIESDKDSDGEPIAYSRINKAFPYINSLPLTSKQKTALAVACGWNLKTVNKNKLW